MFAFGVTFSSALLLGDKVATGHHILEVGSSTVMLGSGTCMGNEIPIPVGARSFPFHVCVYTFGLP